MTDLRDKILDAALPDIVFDGWNMATFKRAAEKAGLNPLEAERAFPGGAVEALDYCTRRADARMVETLKNDYALGEMKIRERIATAVMVRLRHEAPYREAVRRGVAFYSLPWNAPRALKSLYRTVDEMWIAAGDTATDWNFYSKRFLLSQVYMSTLYVWLNDDSPAFADTEAFLRRRIENVMTIQKLKGKCSKAMESVWPLRAA